MQSKIKIIFFTATTSGGGAERMLFNIINSLDENHDVHLVITSMDAVPKGLTLKARISNLGFNKSRKSFYSILNIIKKEKPDYVFTTSSTIGYILVLSKLILRNKFKVFIRCAVTPSEIVKTSYKYNILKFIIKKTYRYCDLLIAQTSFMKRDLIESYGVKEEKISVIRNIVDSEFITNQSKEFYPKEFDGKKINIVASGALYSIKGFDLLIESVVPLIEKNPNIHLWILGDERYEIGYKKNLQNMIDVSNVKNNIKLMGHKENPYPYYKNADLFVMSSRKEGFPNVVLEALFLKTPVVATNCVDFTGIIVNGINGYVVEKNSVESLRDGLLNALSMNFDMNRIRIDNFDYNKLFI